MSEDKGSYSIIQLSETFKSVCQMQCGLLLNREVILSTVRLQMDPQRTTEVPFLRPRLYVQPEKSILLAPLYT